MLPVSFYSINPHKMISNKLLSSIKNNACFIHFFLITMVLAICNVTGSKANAFYLANSGNDSSNGTKSNPWKTIDHLNKMRMGEGDTVYFKSGDIFSGSILIDSNKSGTKELPLVITSYGDGNAIIYSANNTALSVLNVGWVKIRYLHFAGSGRKNGNTNDGVFISGANHITVDSIEVSGFQKAGLLVYNSSSITVTNVYAHENGFAGISVSGANAKADCSDIYIGYCRAENNPGDPTNFTNHSGNGIIAGLCKNVLIEYCTATNNGWDMPRVGNGPVGIWCYEADSVIIQHCISYKNKTAKGAADGGGYDLDGGVTNSVIQYCLSYENEGSGFGLFQYNGASNWYNNTIRYCISENDGGISAAHAGIFIWNSSRDTSQLKNCFIYNNIIYNTKGAAISYEKESENAGFHFYNNIFVAKHALITGKEFTGVFINNCWWSIKNRFKVDNIKSFKKWALQKNKEQWNNKIAGKNLDPRFKRPGVTTLTNPLQLKTFYNYSLPKNSPLKNAGLDLRRLLGIDIGSTNFNGQPAAINGMGACL